MTNYGPIRRILIAVAIAGPIATTAAAMFEAKVTAYNLAAIQGEMK